jgi:multiple sugar transport system substrate-binding protein
VTLIDAFTKATGVRVTISRESVDDVQPKASVAANIGSGPDLIWGFIRCRICFRRNAST